MANLFYLTMNDEEQFEERIYRGEKGVQSKYNNIKTGDLCFIGHNSYLRGLWEIDNVDIKNGEVTFNDKINFDQILKSRVLASLNLLKVDKQNIASIGIPRKDAYFQEIHLYNFSVDDLLNQNKINIKDYILDPNNFRKINFSHSNNFTSNNDINLKYENNSFILINAPFIDNELYEKYTDNTNDVIINQKRQWKKILAINDNNVTFTPEQLYLYDFYSLYMCSVKEEQLNEGLFADFDDENDENYEDTSISIFDTYLESETVDYYFITAKPKNFSFEKLKVNDTISYSKQNSKGNDRKIPKNYKSIKKNDVLICYEATPKLSIVALGIVSEEPTEKNVVIKKIEALSSPIPYIDFCNAPELKEFEFIKNKNGSLFHLTKDEFNYLYKLIRNKNIVDTYDEDDEIIEEKSPYTKDNFLSDVFMTEYDYEDLKELLLLKKNVILQGPPGVGKTFAAERLAYSIIGYKDNKYIEQIQFHQTYSYEDFVYGYKPKKTGDGFEPKAGIFYNFCKIAENDPTKKYFFIIDEINRGNLSKIFGELLMLLENSYRGKKYVKLSINDIEFTVPDNVYIIGMMNTSDRSLSMIDYALRRRFSFYTMIPGFETKGFKTLQNSYHSQVFDQIIEKIQAINIDINKNIGKGCEIGHSYFCTNNYSDKWLFKVIKYDIAPLLEEYWFDNESKAKNYITELNQIFENEN